MLYGEGEPRMDLYTQQRQNDGESNLSNEGSLPLHAWKTAYHGITKKESQARSKPDVTMLENPARSQRRNDAVKHVPMFSPHKNNNNRRAWLTR